MDNCRRLFEPGLKQSDLFASGFEQGGVGPARPGTNSRKEIALDQVDVTAIVRWRCVEGRILRQ